MKTTQKILLIVAGTVLTTQVQAVMYFARPYEPNMARWLTRDPIGERGGLNLYGFVGNNPVNQIDPLGLSVGKILVKGWEPVVEDSFFSKKRGWFMMLYWIPPRNGEWAGPCGCKPCQKAIWTQDVNIQHRGWHQDWGADESNKYGSDWYCSGSFDSNIASISDEPSITGPLWKLAFEKSPYIFKARSYLTCVKGKDAGKIYQTVDWGFTWEYDGTPQGIGPIWSQYEIADQ